MPSQIPIRQCTRTTTVSLRSRHAAPALLPLCLRLAPRRTITSEEKPLPEADKGTTGPNQDQLPHVSEEAAATSAVTGETAPELSQGSPVQEVLSRSKEAQDNAPKVIQDDAKAATSRGTRQFSTSARPRALEMMATESTTADSQATHEILSPALSINRGYGEGQGHLFGLPALPLPSKSHIKHRYDPVVEQFTNLLMQNGKLSRAQRNMALILERLRTAAPPSTNPQKPLIPGAPPTSHLPLNPVLYLTLAIDSLAPLMRIRSQKGAAGGGVALQIPVPLSLRQRRRTSIKWILDAASKRRSKGSGRSMFAQKITEELVSIVEGKSSLWERRSGIHRLGVNARANLNVRIRRR